MVLQPSDVFQSTVSLTVGPEYTTRIIQSPLPDKILYSARALPTVRTYFLRHILTLGFRCCSSGIYIYIYTHTHTHTYIYIYILLWFLDHTQQRTTVGRTPLDERSARRRDLYLTTHNTHNRKISMPPVGFEPTTSAGERPQTYALDRAATGTDNYQLFLYKILTD